MRQEEYGQGILGALGTGEDNGVPEPVWRQEVYLKAIYDALKGSEIPVLPAPAYRQEEYLKAICEAIGSWNGGGVSAAKTIRDKVRAGTIRESLAVGDPITFERETGVYVTVSGVTATVDEDRFIEAVNNRETAVYEFEYDGAAWRLDGKAVEPSNYGLTVSGSPQSGSLVAVHVQGETVTMEVAGFDCDVPVDETLTNSLSLISRDILQYGSIAWCAPQALVSVTAEIPAGTTVYVHGNHCNYAGNTNADGDYALTPTVTVPAGGKIRHSVLGNSNGTTRAQILAGTWTTYDANCNQLETGLATAEDNTGVLLGTVTAYDPQYLSNGAAHVNFTQRNAYGSNRAAHAAMRKWKSSDQKGAAAGAIASWWTPSDEFDMPIRSTLPGWLHGMDPDLIACIAPVWKRTALAISDGYGFEDTQETVWTPSMTEVGFGSNHSVVETSPKGEDGEPNFSGAYPLYADSANEDRIKYDGTTAKLWFLRSPDTPCPYFVISVGATGASGHYYAYGGVGAVNGFCIA